jgi:hypothetical protein
VLFERFITGTKVRALISSKVIGGDACRDPKPSDAAVWAFDPWILNIKVVGKKEVLPPGDLPMRVLAPGAVSTLIGSLNNLCEITRSGCGGRGKEKPALGSRS